MKPSKVLLTLGTLAFTVGLGTTARAEDEIALSFDLEPAGSDDITEDAAEAQTIDVSVVEVDPEAPLAIPAGAENPPISSETTRPNGVYGGLDALALGATQSVQELLPAPPPTPVQIAGNFPKIPQAPEADLEENAPQEAIDDTLAFNLELDFGAETEAAETIADVAPSLNSSDSVSKSHVRNDALTASVDSTWSSVQTLFDGGTDSLVARAVGSAEGTRTPEGHKTPAYFGHVDPGNGVWNLGTFSYQHGAQNPEEADDKQMRRLQRQTEVLQRKAQTKGLELSDEELLNGIDLANQAPLAALDRGGYIDWLKEAQALGMEGSEAIIWARTRSFIDPDTQRWNAPGLGNNIYSIHSDQERRAHAITRAISATSPISRSAQVADTREVAIQEVLQPMMQGTTEALENSDDVALNFLFGEPAPAASQPPAIVQQEAPSVSSAPQPPSSQPPSEGEQLPALKQSELPDTIADAESSLLTATSDPREKGMIPQPPAASEGLEPASNQPFKTTPEPWSEAASADVEQLNHSPQPEDVEPLSANRVEFPQTATSTVTADQDALIDMTDDVLAIPSEHDQKPVSDLTEPTAAFSEPFVSYPSDDNISGNDEDSKSTYKERKQETSAREPRLSQDMISGALKELDTIQQDLRKR
ncbi:hypothetical protein PN498_18385 [Oscillatoria sp. CS-180]|uniref:hypothetical protein n=1 Tax=Oscillatoria sp. CS-180 TaxID=3021720 RepID=UPI00232C1EF7|nr:hypothetical protein [Oscillatoria sp. CS-180]MDB9527968.1 hypothetical protein [Oscillatoria sp. CS-180]